MNRFLNSLSLRLFFSLIGIMAAILLGYVWINLKTTSNLWINSTKQQALQISELIKRSTRQGMLLNRMEDVDETIAQIAREPGIVGIRIYDKQGQIIISDNPDEVGEEVDLQAEACVLCHVTADTLKSASIHDQTRTYRDEYGTPLLAMINPIGNEPACANNACHAHDPDLTVLGVLDVRLSMAGWIDNLAATRTQVISVSILGVILMAGMSGLFIYRIVRVPVASLVEGAQQVAEGDFNTRFECRGVGDLARLGTALNQMTHKLAVAHDEITDWSAQLEQKVMDKTEEVSRSHRQLLHMEKMASLGKLAASVAHELNNPMAGILNYAKLVERSLNEETCPAEEKAELLRYLKHVQAESTRCGNIVKNLLLFSRQSNMVLGEHHLYPLIERSLMVIRHHLDIAGITVDYTPDETDDRILGDGNQLQQVFVALFVNAAEAMPHGGTLSIKVEGRSKQVICRITDSGVGMTAQELPYIFEPFFSTKETTNGVGLGLAVVYGILQQHHGQITAESAPGQGATFKLVLPRTPPAPRPAGDLETDGTPENTA